MKFPILENHANIVNLIPKEFTKEEIAQIRTVFPKAYSKKSYSLRNDQNLLSAECQWYDDVLYADFGYTKSMQIRKGIVHISFYKLEYDRPEPLSYLPRQIGFYHCSKKWDTLDDLKKIKEYSYD